MEAYSPGSAAGSREPGAPSGPAVAIARATEADLPAVEVLLAAERLPLDGARDALATGVVARAGGEVVGAAAVEAYGADGLLRSVVVAPGYRGTGLGRDLVHAAEALASALGVRNLYLITETAAAWFPRLGYAPIARADVPPGVAGSVEFTLACATTGVLMTRRLDG